MKKIIAICAAAALSLTGCAAKQTIKDMRDSVSQLIDESEEKPEKLIIVSGYHSNSYVPDWTLIEEDIFEACSKNAEIQLIIDDGRPFVKSINLDKIDTSLSKNNFDEKVKQNTAKVLSECMLTTAQTEEIDTYTALSLAERCIDKNCNNKILIIDSMFPSKGKIDFRDTPLVSLNIDSVKSFENDLPNLKDVPGTIYGLGEVTGKQPILSSDDYNTLCNFWNTFFEEVGCNFIIDRSPFSVKEEPDSSLPNVSVCIVTEDSNEINKLTDNIIYQLPRESISFEPDTAEFSDKNKAKEKLTDFAAKITDSDKLLLLGMCATSGDAESARNLSLQRSEAVKKLLQELGVHADITCIGTGFDSHALHTNDLNADGSLNENSAEKNRTVLAMTVETAKNYGFI